MNLMIKHKKTLDLPPHCYIASVGAKESVQAYLRWGSGDRELEVTAIAGPVDHSFGLFDVIDKVTYEEAGKLLSLLISDDIMLARHMFERYKVYEALEDRLMVKRYEALWRDLQTGVHKRIVGLPVFDYGL